MKRRYVLPTSLSDVPLAEWLPDLKAYGIDIEFLSQEVLNCFLTNENEMPIAGLMNYVVEVLNQQYETDFNSTSPGDRMRHEYEIETDRMALVCLEAGDTLYDHLKKHFVAIEDREASMGTRTELMDWEICGSTGNDVIIQVSVDEEKEQPDASRL